MIYIYKVEQVIYNIYISYINYNITIDTVVLVNHYISVLKRRRKKKHNGMPWTWAYTHVAS